jgi:hypothetical protein
MSRVPGSLASWKWTEPSGSAEKRPPQDDQVEVEVGIQRGTEAVEEGDGAQLGADGSGEAAFQQKRADRPQEDAEHGSGERGIAGQERA